MILLMLRNLRSMKGSIEPWLMVLIVIILSLVFITFYLGINNWFTNVNIQSPD